MAGAVVFGVFGLAFLCCICCFCNSLRAAIDCIDASADFLWGTKRILAVPLFFFVCVLIVVMLWIGTMALVVSLNKIEPDANIP